MKLIFVRHGHPDYTTDSLTPLGIRQAKAAAERLSNEGITEIHASSCGRACETACFTAELLGLPVTKHDFMREMDWHVLEGCTEPSTGNPWELVKELNEDYDLMRRDWAETFPFCNTASPQSVRAIGDAFDKWLEESFGYEHVGYGYRYTGKGKDNRVVAMFSHGGSSSAALSRMLSLPFPYVCATFMINFTSVTKLILPDDGSIRVPLIEIMFDARHIRGITADSIPQP